jgi:SPP1 family predicted phage head-tail adaptor
VDIGKLNIRLTIQEKVQLRDSWGQASTTWQTVTAIGTSGKIWAWAKTQTGLGIISAERQAGGREVSEVQVSFRVRRNALITAGMRAVYSTFIFDIKQVVPALEHRDYIDLVCSTGTNEG